MEDENLATVLLKKEKELQQLGKLRITHLQEQLREKDETVKELEKQIQRLHEDFNYNFKLIQERDAEIEGLEYVICRLREEASGELGKSTQRDSWGLQEQLHDAKSLTNRLKYEAEGAAAKAKELEETLAEQGLNNEKQVNALKEQLELLNSLKQDQLAESSAQLEQLLSENDALKNQVKNLHSVSHSNALQEGTLKTLQSEVELLKGLCTGQLQRTRLATEYQTQRTPRVSKILQVKSALTAHFLRAS